MDIGYERALLQDPDSPKKWIAYAESRESPAEYGHVLERALARMPRSYKVWQLYLGFRKSLIKGLNTARYIDEYHKVAECYNKALVLLNKMPRIWIDYLTLILQLPDITRTRRTFDRALRALPVSQHHRILPLYLEFAKTARGITAEKILQRYVYVSPGDREDYIDFLVENGKYKKAVQVYISLINDAKFESKVGASHYQLFIQMIELLANHPADMQTLQNPNADQIIRSGIAKFDDQRGKLWTSLATYYINLADFDRARDCFEEGLTNVMTVRDFTLIFDAYAEFEETVLSRLMERANEGGTEDDSQLDLRLMRFEQLMNRRPFLVNDVLLRQNPNNVAQWQKRVNLWKGNDEEVVKTYTDALGTIDPNKATYGHLYDIWINFAGFYESKHDADTARTIFSRGTNVPFVSPNDLAEVWIQWAEFELRQNKFDGAIQLLDTATKGPKQSKIDYFDSSLTPQQRLHKSIKLWSFYVDLVESVGKIDQTRAVYESIFDLKIATPLTVVNYANFLEENRYYEDSFKVYEKGLSMFSYPTAFELWNLYLVKAVKRELSIERLRDLFEQALDGCPVELSKPIYIAYGQVELDRGLTRNAMQIYSRATRAFADNPKHSELRADMYKIYIDKTREYYGLAATRPLYEQALQELADSDCREFALEFSTTVELELGEIDRARSIFAYGSQFADPRTKDGQNYWSKWTEFEVQHGNEDTYKEMLRIKRSVQAQFNTDVHFIATQALERKNQLQQEREIDQAQQYQQEDSQAPKGFVAASTGPVVTGVTPVAQSAPDNPDEIDVDM